MGELQTEPFQFTFNGFLKVAFQGSRITSDAGLILVRELDQRLGLGTLISEPLNDSRQGLNIQFSLADLLRQSVYSRLAGYEDLNDAVRVSADPTFRLIGSTKLWARISDLPVVPYRQDQSPRPDFWGSDVRHHTTEDDTRWVNYSTRRFSSRSTAF